MNPDIQEQITAWAVVDAARAVAHQRTARLAERSEPIHAALRDAERAITAVQDALRAWANRTEARR